MAYPVTYDAEPPETYDRLTVAFRLILAIPQMFLVGGTGLAGLTSIQVIRENEGLNVLFQALNGGVLTIVAGILVFIAWFAIMFTGRFPESFRDFVLMVFRWYQNVHAYLALQTAPYPPFSGNAPYTLRVAVTPADGYKRLTVFFRFFMVIPHAIVLFFLGIAQGVVTVIAWFAILFTGKYPAGMYPFSVGVSRWQARVYAYMWLLVDEYPPFSLAADPDAPRVQAGLA